MHARSGVLVAGNGGSVLDLVSSAVEVGLYSMAAIRSNSFGRTNVSNTNRRLPVGSTAKM
ncbi:MAG: hypothetical protein WA510_29520 [Acidobacteriaceae bacterium]